MLNIPNKRITSARKLLFATVFSSIALTSLAHSTLAGGIEITTSGINITNTNGSNYYLNKDLTDQTETILTNDGTIGKLTNNADISLASGNTSSIFFNNSGAEIDTFTNNDYVDALSGTAFQNYGTITNFNNEGILTASEGSEGYGLLNSGTIENLTNEGTISGTYMGIRNDYGVINSITNNGYIITEEYGALLNIWGTIDSVVNNGYIIAEEYDALSNIWGTIDSIVNNGSIISENYNGIYNFVGTIGTITNNGSIIGEGYDGIYSYYGTIGTIINNGSIIGKADDAIWNYNGTIGNIINNGSMIGEGCNGISNAYGDVTIGSIINNGTIIGKVKNGIYNYPGAIGSIINNATITGEGEHGIYNELATIDEIVNLGTITGARTDILNTGTLKSLTNAQSGLNYGYSSDTSNLPENYYAYFSEPDNMGTISIVNLADYADSMNFNIKGTTFTEGTYAGVISSDTALTGTITTLDYFGVDYDLTTSDGGLTWDLEIISSTDSRVSDAMEYIGSGANSGAAQAIDSSALLSADFTNFSTAEEIEEAVSGTLPIFTGGSQRATGNILSNINRVINARIEGGNGPTGISSGNDYLYETDRKLWIKPFTSKADQKTTSEASGYNSYIFGMVMGYEEMVDDDLLLGMAMGIAQADVKSKSSETTQKNDIDMYQIIGYGNYDLDNKNTSLSFQANVGFNDNQATRYVPLASSWASSKYNSLSAHIGIGLSRIYELMEKTRLTGSIHTDYTGMYDHGYNETGAGNYNLKVDDRYSDELLLGTKAKIERDITSNITVNVQAGATYDILNERTSITAAYAGAPGSSFTTEGIKPSAWTGHGGTEIVNVLENGMEISGEYAIDFRKNFNNQTASLKVKIPF